MCFSEHCLQGQEWVYPVYPRSPDVPTPRLTHTPHPPLSYLYLYFHLSLYLYFTWLAYREGDIVDKKGNQKKMVFFFKVYLSKLHFKRCFFSKVYFSRAYCSKRIFQKRIFQKSIFGRLTIGWRGAASKRLKFQWADRYFPFWTKICQFE